MNSNGTELEEVIDFTSYLIGLVQSSFLNILIFKSLSGFQSSLLLVDFRYDLETFSHGDEEWPCQWVLVLSFTHWLPLRSGGNLFTLRRIVAVSVGSSPRFYSLTSATIRWKPARTATKRGRNLSDMWRSTFKGFAPVQKSRRNQRPYVRAEPLSSRIFVSVQELSGRYNLNIASVFSFISILITHLLPLVFIRVF